jgi:ribosomal subunit interface protein
MALLHIKSPHLELTEAMDEYANDKLGKVLEKFEDFTVPPTEIVFKVEKHTRSHGKKIVGTDEDGEDELVSEKEKYHGKETHLAEATVHCKGKVFVHASAQADTMYASIDYLADMLKRQLRKRKEKMYHGMYIDEDMEDQEALAADLDRQADEDVEAFDLEDERMAVVDMMDTLDEEELSKPPEP